MNKAHIQYLLVDIIQTHFMLNHRIILLTRHGFSLARVYIHWTTVSTCFSTYIKRGNGLSFINGGLIRTFYIKRIKRGISPCLIPRGYSKYVAFGHIMLRPETEARHHMMGVYSHWEILKLDGHLNIFIFRTFRTCFHQCDLGSWFFSLKSIESSFEKIAAVEAWRWCLEFSPWRCHRLDSSAQGPEGFERHRCHVSWGNIWSMGLGGNWF